MSVSGVEYVFNEGAANLPSWSLEHSLLPNLFLDLGLGYAESPCDGYTGLDPASLG